MQMRTKTPCRLLLFFSLVILSSLPIVAQETSDTIRQKTETILSKRKTKISVLPALSYAPETKFTLGAIGMLFTDFAEGDTLVPMSNFRFIAVYTTAKQVILQNRFNIITKRADYIFRGRLEYRNASNRHYGLGNDAMALSVGHSTTEEENGIIEHIDSLNYLAFRHQRLVFRTNALRKIRPKWYVGFNVDFTYDYDYKNNVDSLVSASPELSSIPFNGWRSGIGLTFNIDQRDNIVNPLKGSYLEVISTFYNRFLGSDYEYARLTLDARKYFNFFRQQTLALRLYSDHRFPFANDAVPFSALAKYGGHDLGRGYFSGTYQDYHLFLLQAEYRIPIWKRIGMVALVNGGQTYGEANDFAVKDWHWAVGGGLRVMLDKKERLNVRVDFAIGLDANADFDGRQTGIYFQLAESF